MAVSAPKHGRTEDDRPPAAAEIEQDDILDIDPEEEVLPLFYTITSYGADFLVDGLVSRMQSGDIEVPTFDPEFDSTSELSGFQRDFVWAKPQADKFLESLLLGMPVPGIFLVREPDGVFLVLDGHQRLQTLQSFYEGVFRGREHRLEFAQQPWRGKTYKELDVEDRRRLDSSILHATILRQDHPERDYTAIYSIFERINTGGTSLQPQEIRVALFGGPFIKLIRLINANSDWRALYGPRSSRLKDQELILRFFALYVSADTYSRPLKGFLNDFLSANVDLDADSGADLVQVFTDTVAAINAGIGPSAFRPVRSLNAAVVDSIMVGVACRIAERGPIEKPQRLRSPYERLINNAEYTAATVSSTAAEESVERRLALASAAFRSV
jgi:Protein of unknown function DUF262